MIVIKKSNDRLERKQISEELTALDDAIGGISGGGGVPAGGTTDQHLAKINGTDYNTQWVDPPATAAGVPAGGTTAQHLAKINGTDYNTEWVGDGQETHPIGPDFTYTSGDLTRIDYDGGEYKVLTYSGGALIQVDYISNGLTKRKVFTYGVGGELDYITQSFV